MLDANPDNNLQLRVGRLQNTSSLIPGPFMRSQGMHPRVHMWYPHACACPPTLGPHGTFRVWPYWWHYGSFKSNICVRLQFLCGIWLKRKQMPSLPPSPAPTPSHLMWFTLPCICVQMEVKPSGRDSGQAHFPAGMVCRPSVQARIQAIIGR